MSYTTALHPQFQAPLNAIEAMDNPTCFDVLRELRFVWNARPRPNPDDNHDSVYPTWKDFDDDYTKDDYDEEFELWHIRFNELLQRIPTCRDVSEKERETAQKMVQAWDDSSDAVFVTHTEILHFGGNRRGDESFSIHSIQELKEELGWEED
jgi:hypothetical protein